MSEDWILNKKKDDLHNDYITVMAKKDDMTVPVKLHILAITLNYAPLIYYAITSDTPLKNPLLWDDHPFKYLTDLESTSKVSNIIDDTEATRAIFLELLAEPQNKLYTTTDCSHKGRLINALSLFWS
jgi:hypothetical protein